MRRLLCDWLVENVCLSLRLTSQSRHQHIVLHQTFDCESVEVNLSIHLCLGAKLCILISSLLTDNNTA